MSFEGPWSLGRFWNSAGARGWPGGPLSQQRSSSLCVAKWVRGVRGASGRPTGDSRVPRPHVVALLFWAVSNLFKKSPLQPRCSGWFKPPCHQQGRHLLKRPLGRRCAHGAGAEGSRLALREGFGLSSFGCKGQKPVQSRSNFRKNKRNV